MPRLQTKVPLPIALAVALMGAGFAAGCGGDAESADDQESTRMIPPAEGQEEERPGAQAGVPTDDVDSSFEDMAEGPEAGDANDATGSAGAGEAATPPAPVRTNPPRTADRDEPSRPGTSDSGTTPPADQPPPVAERTDEDSPGFDLPADDRADARGMLTVPAGTRLELVMEQELSTRHHRVGSPFTARLQEDVLGPRGEVLIGAGSRVRGSVVESRLSEGADRPAVLVLGVEMLEDGTTTRRIQGEVVEVEQKAGVRDSNTETAAKVGAGAVAGAILGKLIGGDRDDAVRGAVGGAVAGAAVAVGTRDGHAVIEEGARIVVRLDEPVVIAEG